MDRNYVTIPVAMFFNQFVVSPFRAFLVIVLDELGYTAYEIGTIVAIGDLSALLGSIIGAAVSDHIGRRYSSFIGRSMNAAGMFLMYMFFTHKLLFVASFALYQMGLLWARAASYILMGETSESRVNFGAYSLAINDLGGLLGLLIFVKALNGFEAVEIFRDFMPLRTLSATISAIAILLSRETSRVRKGARLKITKSLLAYLLLIAFVFFGIAISRTFSPLYAKYVIGISDDLWGKISMISIGVEALFFFAISRLNLTAIKSAILGLLSYSSLAFLVVARPTKISAIVGFGILSPGFTAFFRPALLDLDISITDPSVRGRLISIIFMFRRLGLMGGRIAGARIFVINPALVMVIPVVTMGLGLAGIIKTAERRF